MTADDLRNPSRPRYLRTSAGSGMAAAGFAQAGYDADRGGYDDSRTTCDVTAALIRRGHSDTNSGLAPGDMLL